MTRALETLTLGTRGSQLALWQTEWVKGELTKAFPSLDIRVEVIKTTGDKILDSPLAKIGDKGLFTREIEQALLDGRIDLAVHSLKDLPTELPDGLTIGAITAREDVRDVFISHPAKRHRSVDEIPPGGTLATGSLRRRAQLLHWRPDLVTAELRGNLNTRFAKLDASHWDGMILAKAGVTRLGWADRIAETLATDRMLPAVGQGALGIEIRSGDGRTGRYVSALADGAATISTLGERALLRTLEGGCQVPIGAHGRVEKDVFILDAVIASLDGKQLYRGRVSGATAASESLGVELARTLLKSGGKAVLEQIRNTEPAPAPEA